MQPTIDEIINWTRQAGQVLREGYGNQHAINHKGQIDLVTEMDQRAEAFLVEHIRSKYPDHTIYAEESGHISGIDGACWYIDPLDGTTNYAHNIPLFAVSVAYAEGGEVIMGAVFDPMRDECFSAVYGQGAWLNQIPIHVSDTQDLISSLLVTGFPYDRQVSQKNVRNFGHLTWLSQGVRRMGSAAIDLCYIASGRFDGYWELSLQPYDLAAGALIAREAGGRVTSITGDENLFQPPYSIAAGNPAIHPLLLKELNNPA